MIYIKSRDNMFQIEVDGLSDVDSIELDRQAALLARERYNDHIDRLYRGAPDELEETISWVLLPRGNRVWKTFRGYFLHAKLRILLSKDPQPVYRCCYVNPSIDNMLVSLCEEHNVDYRHISKNQSKKSTNNLRSALEVFETRFPQHISKFLYLTRWFIFILFIVLRPIILNLYKFERDPVKVRFWVDPRLPDRDRFFNSPDNVNSKGETAGYACYDANATSSVWGFILSTLANVQMAFDPNQPISVEWYTDPEDFRRVIELTPHIADITRRAGRLAKDQSNSPDFTFLARQLETVPTDVVFQALLLESAIKGFGRKVDDEVWTHTQNLTKFLPRILAIIGDQEDIATVAVANHYYSETRITDHFTERETDDREAVILPDLFVVWETRSATTLREQGIPTEKIAIARDKLEAEARDIEENYTIKHSPPSTNDSSTTNTEDRSVRVLVPLQETTDDIGLSAALEHVSNSLPNIKFVIKPHPYFTPHDSLLELLEENNFVITSADTSFAKIIDICDICVSMYSTATFPALACATPVVWVPFASPNQFFMDLIGEVGIQTDDPEDLAETLERLIQDETFYEKQARECAQFADRELVPDADVPSLANMLIEAGGG